MESPTGDVFYPVVIVATAADIAAARQGAWEFHKQDSPRFRDTVEMMLTIGVSPTGTAPATNFICPRHDTLEALGRIEAYQKALEVAGKSRVPVTLYVAKEPLDLSKPIEPQIRAHEAETLATLALRRAA